MEYIGDYEKYLPEFEQIVKSFRFVGSPQSETENENQTNTTTNFSGANLPELYNDCLFNENHSGKTLGEFTEESEGKPKATYDR